MARITLARILKSIAQLCFACFVVGLFWCLPPSFPVPLSQRDNYISARLSSGQSVITTFILNEIDMWDPGFRELGFIMPWQFRFPPRSDDRSSLGLQIGETVIPLGNIVDLANDFFEKSNRSAGKDALWEASDASLPVPYFSSLAFDFKPDRAWAHPFSMSWWTAADKVLLGYEFNRTEPDPETGALCIVLPMPHVVQVRSAKNVHTYLRQIMKMVLMPGGQDGSQVDVHNKHYKYLMIDHPIHDRGNVDNDYGKIEDYIRDLEHLNAETTEEERSDIISKTYGKVVGQRFGAPVAEFNSSTLFGDTRSAAITTDQLISARIRDGELPTKSFYIRRILAVPMAWIYRAFYAIIIYFPVKINSLYIDHGLILWPLTILIILSCAVLYLTIYIPWVSDGRPDFIKWGAKNRCIQLWWRCWNFCFEGRRLKKMKGYWAHVKGRWSTRDNGYVRLVGGEDEAEYQDDEESSSLRLNRVDD